MIRYWFFRLCVLWSLASVAGSEDVSAEELRLTFFGWSDQHVQTNGDGDHLLPAMDALNELPGKPFPESIGGQVEKPAFVFGCGDVTEWPTHAAVTTYEKLITTHLRWPAYDILGNHDEGGGAPARQ